MLNIVVDGVRCAFKCISLFLKKLDVEDHDFEPKSYIFQPLCFIGYNQPYFFKFGHLRINFIKNKFQAFEENLLPSILHGTGKFHHLASISTCKPHDIYFFLNSLEFFIYCIFPIIIFHDLNMINWF